jgi:hypothetical protein
MRTIISCTSENGSHWCDKVENLLLSIRRQGGSLAGAPAVVNVVGGVTEEFASRLAGLDATIRTVERFPALAPASNKLRMLELVDEFDFDVLVALDCDMIVTGDIGHFLSTTSLRAVPESRDPFATAQWHLIFDAFGIPPPPRDCPMISSGDSTFPFFKSGVLLIPSGFCGVLRDGWATRIKLYEDLCESPDGSALNRWFADQAGLALTVTEDRLPFEPLPVGLNFPMKSRIAARFAPEVRPPFVIHSGSQLDAEGFVLASRHRAVNPHVDEFNRYRADWLGRPYEGLRRPPLPRRVQMAAKDHAWYRSPLSRRLRRSAAIRSVKRMLLS